MKSVIVASALATVVLAQSSPLIPSGISSGCSAYLQTLNTDTSMSSCLSSITTATSAFGPTANSSASSSDVSSALSALCSSSACSDSTLRSQLAAFYAACQAELVTSPNQDVLTQYDALYALSPLKDALCTTSSGQYCVQTIGAALGGSSSRKRDTTQVVLKPSASAFKSSNIAFLRLSASAPNATLCSDCSKQVLTTWISALNAAAYAPGIDNSPMLGGWSDLYNGTLAACGASFLDSESTNNAQGTLNSGIISANAAPATGAPASVLGMLSALALAVLAF